jgi:NAD-dependent deacetylase
MSVERTRQLLAQADSVLVITGAGISAESGIPTFRGEGGLWKGFEAQELATPGAFQANPQLVWEWYAWRRRICNEALPNPGHAALVTLERTVHACLLVTQNVDGLHPRAGSQKLIEIHGCIDQARCTETGRVFAIDEGDHRDGLVFDPESGALARPHILWFGETYWSGTLDVAQGVARRGVDVCLVVGTSGMVWPPAALALMAKEHGAVLIEVNPNAGQVTPEADIWLKGPSGKLLPQVV